MGGWFSAPGHRAARLPPTLHDWTSRRLNLRRCVSIVLLLVAIVFILLMTWYFLEAARAAPKPLSDKRRCLGTSCFQRATIMARWTNKSVDPCRNFYQHACGRFHVHHPRGDNDIYGVQEMLEEYNNKRLQDLLQDQYANGTAFNKSAALFTSCMQASKDDRSMREFIDLINPMGGLDILGTWTPKRYDFQSIITQISSLGMPSLFRVVIDDSLQLSVQSAQMEHVIWKSYRLQSRLYKEEDSNYTAQQDNLRHNIQTVLQAFPINSTACNDSSCLNTMVNDIITVESQLWDLSAGAPQSITVAELDQAMTNIDWRILLGALYETRLAENNVTITVLSIQYMKSIDNLINSTSNATMHNFLIWSWIRNILPLLGDKFYSFHQQLHPRHDPTIPWSQFCVDLVRAEMPYAVSALVVQHHLGADNQQSAAHLFDAAKSTVTKLLHIPASKEPALYQNISLSFGQAKTASNQSLTDKHYEHLQMSSTDFLRNTIALRKFRIAARLARGSSAVRSLDMWEVPHDFLTLRYQPIDNTMLVPYGALQSPWFHRELPAAVNTAALGSLILESLYQAIVMMLPEASEPHPRASDFDPIVQRLNLYKLCVQESFSKLSTKSPTNVEPTSSPGGMTENHLQARVFAEHFSLQSSFDLFRQLQTQETASVLPGQSSRSAEEIFFIAFAQARCENADPIIELPGSEPTEYIINNLVFNDAAFKAAFQCSSVPDRYADNNTCSLL